MATDRSNERGRSMGRAQMLQQALQDVRRRREEGLGSSSPLVPRGRVGIVPWDLTGRGPQNRERRPGGLSTWSGRGGGRVLPPPSPPPLENIPTLRVGRFQSVGPLR